jgi:hypothetical protein
MACVLEEMGTIQEKMDAYQKMVPDGQEKMKAHVGSLASQINVNQ